ncbi:unnamed protein product [Cochlearia groenlandica]
MENSETIKQEEPSSPPSPSQIFEIHGEPAIIINGVPNEPQTDFTITKVESSSTSSGTGNTVGCGVWFEGRQVQKFFSGKYYSGVVKKFDKDSEWYRVEYEDGDSEDLDWFELDKVLVPLDVNVSLRSVSLSVIKNRKKTRKS